jgi:hypothetical protein
VSVPVTRLATIAMAAVICFVLIVPLALRRHNVALAVVAGALFAAYAIVNVVVWRRLTPPS